MVVTKNMLFDEVAKAMREVKKTYDSLAEESWKKKAYATPDYEPLPKRGVLYDQESRDAYNKKVEELREAANKVVKAYIGGHASREAKAPTEDELRTVEMFLHMDPSTLAPEDYRGRLETLMTKYQDSAVTYETLRSHAAKAGFHDFKPHPLIEEKQAMENITRNVDSFFAHRRVTSVQNEKPVSDGEISWQLAWIQSDCDKLGE